MRFRILVLRFMSIIVRATWVGDWSTGEMKSLLNDIENEIERIKVVQVVEEELTR